MDGPTDGTMDEQTLLQSRTIQLCSPKKTLLELSLQVPVGQVWTLFECALEVMYTLTQLKSADNFARPVNLLLKKNKDSCGTINIKRSSFIITIKVNNESLVTINQLIN